MRTICVVTATRAEYGLLRPVVQKLAASSTLQLQLVATGGAIASKSQLSFSDPVATVSAKDKKGTIAISQLHISGTTSIQHHYRV